MGKSRKSKQKLTEAVYKTINEKWKLGKVEKTYTRMSSDFKPILLHYDSNYQGELNNHIRVELITFTNPFPTQIVKISPLVNRLLTDDEINIYDMNSFEVLTQSPKRTFIEKILIQKEIYKDNEKLNVEPETQKDRARDFYDIHKIWQYYDKKPDLSIEEFDKFVESRKSNRNGKEIITKEEFNTYSLVKIFKDGDIELQLNIDKTKLSIRDLDVNEILKSLKEIDEKFKQLLYLHKIK